MSSPEEDLSLTVRELSNVYEELSLLYRLSDVFSLLTVDEMCSKIAQEAMTTIGVETTAVLLLDEKGEKLCTKTCLGNWNVGREYSRDAGALWRVIDSRRPSAFCNLAETEYRHDFPEIMSLMICPLPGKVKMLGVILVADKSDCEEFFSHDSKLLMAIAVQAGLAIENALLHSDMESLLLGAIRSLVKMLEASSYWTAGHTERVTEYSLGIGRVMGLAGEAIDKLKITALLHDIGKIATPKEILNKEGALHDAEWTEIKRHPARGAEILVELKQFGDVIQSIKYHHEHWDGMGIFGLKGEEIPLAARILSVADAFDAMTSDRPYRKMNSKEEAVQEIVRCSGSQFDPDVVRSFLVWVDEFSPRHQVSEF